MYIRPFSTTDENSVIALWQRCDLISGWNDPRKDIARKLKVDPELFLVGVIDEQILATIMGGYDGHRGWVNYLAVDPSCQRRGFGAALMMEMEKLLLARGCAKLNLQIRNSNQSVIDFYHTLGYSIDEVVSMGKRLVRDD